MAEKPKKDRPRALPRNLPDDPIPTTREDLLSGRHLEDRIVSDLDFSGLRIPTLAGSNLLFERVSFANSEIGSLHLTDARLTDCDLSNATVRVFHATRVELLGAKLMGLNALGSRWQDVLVDRADARFAQLSESRIHRSEIRATQLREAALNRIDFEATRFHDVVLRQAELAETKLAGLDLRTCDLDGIVLHLEDLRGAIVTAPQAMELARFLGLVIR